MSPNSQMLPSQHEELLRRVDRLRVILAAPDGVLPPGRVRRLVEREISRLREQLLLHLEWEEKDGYMTGVLAAHPDWSGEVDRLRNEHQHLRVLADNLLAAAWDDVDLAILRSHSIPLLDVILRHEAAESTLLNRAFA